MDIPSNTYYIEPFLAPKKFLTLSVDGSHLYFIEKKHGNESRTQLWVFNQGQLKNLHHKNYKLTLGTLTRFYYNGTSLSSSSGSSLTYIPNTGSLSLQPSRTNSTTMQMFLLIPHREFPHANYERHFYHAKSGQKFHILSSHYDRILAHLNDNIMIDVKKRGTKKSHQWYFHQGRITNVESGKVLTYFRQTKAISLQEPFTDPSDVIRQLWSFNGRELITNVDGQVIQLDGNEKQSCEFRVIPVPKEIAIHDQFSPRVNELIAEVNNILDKVQNDGEILPTEEIQQIEMVLNRYNSELERIKRGGGSVTHLEKLLRTAMTTTLRWKLQKEKIRSSLSKIYEEVLLKVNFRRGRITKKEKLILEETGMKYLLKLDNFGTLSEDLRMIRKNIISHIKQFQKNIDSSIVVD